MELGFLAILSGLQVKLQCADFGIFPTRKYASHLSTFARTASELSKTLEPAWADWFKTIESCVPVKGLKNLQT